MNPSARTILDLTQTLAPGIPIWPGDPSVAIDPVATIPDSGYLLHQLQLGEASGTHFACSAHFATDGVTMEAFPAEQLIVPGVCIDVRQAVLHDSDFELTVDWIQQWEKANGSIPERSAVLLCTGWSRHWHSPERYLAPPTPGYGLAAAQMLAQQRGVVGLGIDTHGIDRGSDTTFSVNNYWLHGGRFHLENLTNLESLPAAGFMLFVGALNIAGGAGSPARVLAMVGSNW
ncbi:MAG: cyclase family protein [Chlorobi bacterium]|nr:cyclase family protein [Chlorobiota bacterium]MBX7216870.1 cyclase family protein [Candidatus Kapabacteria bacterium]